MKPIKFISRIVKVEELAPNVKNISLSVPEDFEFTAGQYISFIIEIDGKKIRRPYSIASSPSEKNHLDLCIKIIPEGIATPTIDKLNEDGEILILGPLGEFNIQNKNKNLVFISNSTGIGPFRSMIKDLLQNNFKNKIILIAGYRNEEDVLYDNEFKELEKKHSKFTYKLALSSKNSRVQNILNESKEFIDLNADYYLCGLNDMISSVRVLLTKKSIPMRNIYSEKYD